MPHSCCNTRGYSGGKLRLSGQRKGFQMILWVDTAVKCFLTTLLHCLKDKDLSSFNWTWCFGGLYFSSNSESMPQEKKSLSHLRHLLVWQTQTRTHVLFPQSWQMDLKSHSYKESSHSDARHISSATQKVQLEWRLQFQNESLSRKDFCPGPSQRSAWVTQKDGDIHPLPRSAPVPVTRPPSEQQGYWDDHGDSEEKPKAQGFGQYQGSSPAKA